MSDCSMSCFIDNSNKVSEYRSVTPDVYSDTIPTMPRWNKVKNKY